MQTKNYVSKYNIPIVFIGMLAFIFTSCNSSKYAAEDGIYADEETVVVEADEDKSNYYKQYFKSKEAEYASLPEEDLIFTDIESYTTDSYIDDEGYIVTQESGYSEGYGAWGTNGENVTVNVYNNPGFGGYWGGWYGYGWGGFYRPWYGGYWGGPYYGIGWGGPFWNVGWGNAWYGGYWGNPYFGYGYGYGGFYGYGNHYGYGGFYRDGIAYNRGRRNAGDYGRSYNRNAYNNSGRGSYSRSQGARRSYSRDASRSVRGYNGNVRSRSGVQRPTRATRGSSPRNNSVQRSRSNTRSSAPNRSSRPSYSRPSSSRSSGSMRSSGGSRSSGSMRGSGGSRRGGGRG